jgi:hypothetical protein
MDEAKYVRFVNDTDQGENRLWDYYIVGEKLPEVNNV